MNKYKELLVLPAFDNLEEIIRGLSMPVVLTKGKYSKLEFIVKRQEISILHNGKDIRKYSNIWLSSTWNSRDIAYAVKLYLEHNCVDHTFVEKVTSKLTDHIVFGLNGLPIPNTYFSYNTSMLDYVNAVERVCGYPMIVKNLTGSGGRDSVYLSDKNDFLSKLPLLNSRRKYLYQQYIPNDYDWGILVANGKVVSAERSYPQKGEFRNNYCNGATEIFEHIDAVPEEIKQLAIRASNLLGLSWSRADIIVDKYTNEPYLMEVNRYPGISAGTTEVAGAQYFLESHLGK